jgi:hypothetical protein
VLKFSPKYTPKEGAREIFQALKEGKLIPDDPRTITVKWYKNLIEMDKILKEIKINDVVL